MRMNDRKREVEMGGHDRDEVATPARAAEGSGVTGSSGRLGRDRTHRFPWAVIGVLLMLTPACASVGRDFPVSYVSSIEKGVTTQAQVQDRFGPPWRVGVEDGKTTWTYGKYKYRLFGQPSTTDLVVRFDNRGVVASYSYSTTEYGKDEGR